VVEGVWNNIKSCLSVAYCRIPICSLDFDQVKLQLDMLLVTSSLNATVPVRSYARASSGREITRRSSDPPPYCEIFNFRVPLGVAFARVALQAIHDLDLVQPSGHLCVCVCGTVNCGECPVGIACALARYHRSGARSSLSIPTTASRSIPCTLVLTAPFPSFRFDPEFIPHDNHE
jgi:hypothetical protein